MICDIIFIAPITSYTQKNCNPRDKSCTIVSWLDILDPHVLYFTVQINKYHSAILNYRMPIPPAYIIFKFSTASLYPVATLLKGADEYLGGKNKNHIKSD